MEIRVSSHIEVLNPSDKIIEYAKNYLVMENPEYKNKMRMGFYVRNIDEHLTLYVKDGNKLILPFGCLKEIFAIAKQEGVTVMNNLNKPIENDLEEVSLNLYDYQEVAVTELYKGKNGILEAPCGAGKTQVGIGLIQKTKQKTLWLTHTIDLMNQSMQRAKFYFPKARIGTITGGKVNIGEDITFATVQTMVRLDPKIYKDSFGCVIVDECHRCVGTPTQVGMFYKVLSNINCRYKYGLTATVKRVDNLERCMFVIIGDVLHTIKKKELENKILIAQHEKVDIDLEYDAKKYLNTDGTANYSKMIECLSFDARRNDVIVQNVCYLASKGRTQLILCERVLHTQILAERIKKYKPDLDVSIVTGDTAKKNRKYNSSVIIATYPLAKEGLDIPALDTLHLATPQKNKITVVQSAGRIERNIEGKQTPIIYDYVDTNITYCVNAFVLRKRYIKNKNKE